MLERYSRMFQRFWRRHGSPTLDIIPPVSAWTLPAGITYNAQYDQFLNASNVVQAANYASWATSTSVGFLPRRRETEASLTIGGVLSAEVVSTSVVIEWTSAMQSKITLAWGVVIGSTLYRVRSWTVVPEGVDDPIEIRVELDKAE